jgi:hypothetical protein
MLGRPPGTVMFVVTFFMMVVFVQLIPMVRLSVALALTVTLRVVLVVFTAVVRFARVKLPIDALPKLVVSKGFDAPRDEADPIVVRGSSLVALARIRERVQRNKVLEILLFILNKIISIILVDLANTYEGWVE